MTEINGFDCDGVISIPGGGVYPGPNDIIITGRSIEEKSETEQYLKNRGIENRVYFNPLKFKDKTRESSGGHKANVIITLKMYDIKVVNFFEDDEIQAAVIRDQCPWVNVIILLHNLIEKGNVRRDAEGNEV